MKLSKQFQFERKCKSQRSLVVYHILGVWCRRQCISLLIASVLNKKFPHQLSYQQECIKRVHRTDLNLIEATPLDASKGFAEKSVQNTSPQNVGSF